MTTIQIPEMPMDIIQGEQLRQLNEIERKISQTQVIIGGDTYLDYLDKDLLIKLRSFQYKEKLFYSIHSHQPVINKMVLEKQKVLKESIKNLSIELDECIPTSTQAVNTYITSFLAPDPISYCVCDWGCQNDNILDQMKTFNHFIELLYSDKYKQYIELTKEQHGWIQKMKQCDFQPNQYALYPAVRELTNEYMIVPSICTRAEWWKLCEYLDDCYHDIRKLEYNGILLSISEIMKQFQPTLPSYPIVIHRGDTNPFKWLERKSKVYSNDDIEIQVPNEEKIFKVSSSSTSVSRPINCRVYIIEGEEEKHKEEEEEEEEEKSDSGSDSGAE